MDWIDPVWGDQSITLCGQRYPYRLWHGGDLGTCPLPIVGTHWGTRVQGGGGDLARNTLQNSEGY